MKRVVRLNENDVEKLVRKIISEEKKSINEGPLGWIRKKLNRDEDLGLLILKGLKKGNVQHIRHSEEHGGFQHIFTCNLDGHDIMARRSYAIHGGSHYYVSIDGEVLQLSEATELKIYELMADIENEPIRREKERKMSDARTRLSAYNLPDEERKQIEDTDNFFQ